MAASTGAIRAGRAFVEIGGDDSKLLKVLNKSSDRMKAWAGNMARVGGSLIAAGTAITAPLTAAVFSFSEAGDKLDKMSIRTGASVESLSALGFAAEQSGSSIDALGSGLFRMRRRIANATTGAGPAKRALDALGLSADELTKLDSDQQLLKVADSLAKVEDDSLAAQYAFEILGDGGKALLPLLQSGADGINAMMLEAQELGLVVSQSQSKAGADFMDAWNRITRSSKASIFLLGGELAPILTDLAKHVLLVTKAVQQWIRENGHIIRLAAGIGAGLIALGGVILALSGIVYVAGLGVGLLAGGISFLGGVVSFLVSPMGLVLAALAGILYYSGAGGQALDWLSERFSKLSEFVTNTFGMIKKAMNAGEYKLAGELLWSAIQMVWYEGMQAIMDRVNTWKKFFLDVWEGAIDNAASYFIDKWAMLQKAWTHIAQFFGDVWDLAISGIVSAWKDAQNTIADYALEIVAQIDPEFDLEGARESLNEMNSLERKNRTNARNQSILQRDQAARKELEQIEQNRVGAQQANAEEADRKREAREKQLSDSLGESRRAVNEARANFIKLGEKVSALPDPDKTQLVQNAKNNQNFAQTSPTVARASGGSSIDLRSEAGVKLIADLLNQSGEDKSLKELAAQTGILGEVAKILDKRLLKSGRV